MDRFLIKKEMERKKKKELEYTKITHALFKDMWKTSLDFDSRIKS